MKVYFDADGSLTVEGENATEWLALRTWVDNWSERQRGAAVGTHEGLRHGHKAAAAVAGAEPAAAFFEAGVTITTQPDMPAHTLATDA